MSEPRVPAVADLMADQRRRWAGGERVPVEDYVRQRPALTADVEGLLDLIYHEVYLRERLGESPEREEYQRRFPRLAQAIAAQFDVHQAIQVGGVDPLPDVPGYEVLGEIGHGGMGRVYRARDEKRGGLVAVKALRDEHRDRRGVRQRFLVEARAAADLCHPHIVRVLAVGESYFVMELIDGPSLDDVIREGVPDVARAVALLVPVAEAIHYAHGRGVIHRDLKPANVMIDALGRPRVTDFGMAKLLKQTSHIGVSSTGRGTILGTPCYMPPEQAGDSDIRPGPYSDVYSLGAILYALLAGRPPFDEGSFLSTVLKVRSPQAPSPPRSLRPEIPEVLERICLKCLQKRPSDRYASAADLAAALRRLPAANGG
jgi:serine/threonine protein kinase